MDGQSSKPAGFLLRVRMPAQDFPFKSQSARHDVRLIIEAEGERSALIGRLLPLVIIIVNQIKEKSGKT